MLPDVLVRPIEEFLVLVKLVFEQRLAKSLETLPQFLEARIVLSLTKPLVKA